MYAFLIGLAFFAVWFGITYGIAWTISRATSRGFCAEDRRNFVMPTFVICIVTEMLLVGVYLIGRIILTVVV